MHLLPLKGDCMIPSQIFLFFNREQGRVT